MREPAASVAARRRAAHDPAHLLVPASRRGDDPVTEERMQVMALDDIGWEIARLRRTLIGLYLTTVGLGLGFFVLILASAV